MCALKKRLSVQSCKKKEFRSNRQTKYWFRQYPALRRAYQVALSRFAELPGVCGLGIGRKFQEKKGRYALASKSAGGLCVKIFVVKKRGIKELSKKERIPKYLIVDISKAQAKIRILLDVVEVGQPRLSGTSKNLKHTWPTAGCINVGRIFSFGHSAVTKNSGTFKEKEAELGTVGSLIMERNGAHWATSAGHVFIDMNNGNYRSPDDDRALGVNGKKWIKILREDFLPTRIMENGHVTDALLFKVPENIVPEKASWPSNFDGLLATSDDIDAAIHDEHINGLLWVERTQTNNKLQRIPIDLMDSMNFFYTTINDVKVKYGFTWKYRYMSNDETIGGDSGSPVFIKSLEGEKVRLLGFHYLHDSEHGYGYAVDAKTFFFSLSYIPGNDFHFKGFDNIDRID